MESEETNLQNITFHQEKLMDELNKWHDIWSNFMSNSINPSLYQLLISIYGESNQFDPTLYQILDYMILKYTIFTGQFNSWYIWFN